MGMQGLYMTDPDKKTDKYNDRLVGTSWKYHYCPEGVTIDCQDHKIAEGADKPPKNPTHPPDLSFKWKDLKKKE